MPRNEPITIDLQVTVVDDTGVVLPHTVLPCICWEYYRRRGEGMPHDLAYVTALQFGSALVRQPDQIDGVTALIALDDPI